MMDPCPPRPRRRPPPRAPRARRSRGELFLIDGNSLAYRAFFALPESIATHDGRPTNAIYGLASMFAKMLIDSTRPPWSSAGTRAGRAASKTYEPYKSQRKPRPDLLRDQWPHLMPLADAFGFTNIKVDGFEADDVIATLVKRAREQDVPVMVVSGDRDVYQLVDDGVRVMTTSRGVTDTKIYDRDGVVERYGVAARAGHRPDRPQGRHVGQHPRRPRHRRQDRRPAAPGVRRPGRACSPTSTRFPAPNARRTSPTMPRTRASPRSWPRRSRTSTSSSTSMS